MRFATALFLIFILSSCLKNTATSVDQFRVGTFRTVLEDNDLVSVAVRTDSLQIENFNNKKDTFTIEWLDSFEYVLRKKNPKSLLDSTDFHVKIVSISGDSYEFRAYYSGSKFQQKGTAYKIE